jgi:drug/metabolite transporter superfamily protein YnfA
MLAVAGGWLIVIVLRSVTAIPLILLWLVALRTFGWIPRLTARRSARSDQHRS